VYWVVEKSNSCRTRRSIERAVKEEPEVRRNQPNRLNQLHQDEFEKLATGSPSHQQEPDQNQKKQNCCKCSKGGHRVSAKFASLEQILHMLL
jgi:hypothetical protein